MMARSRLSFALAAFVFLGPSVTAAQNDRVIGPETRMIRVAYTTWLSPSDGGNSEGVQFLRRYLTSLEEASKRPDGLDPVRFDISLGNYYQVLAWLKSGLVDAAIATPFVAALLERDGVAFPTLELATNDQIGYVPVIAASGAGLPNPLGAYETYLHRLLEASRTNNPKNQQTQELHLDYRLNFVAHLSASGFVLPLVNAQQWLDANGDNVDASARQRFWTTLIESAHFTLFHGSSVGSDRHDIANIYFSYCARLTAEALCEGRSSPLSWRPYSLEPAAGRAENSLDGGSLFQRAVPNDVLVLSPGVGNEVNWPTSDRAVSDQLLNLAIDDSDSTFSMQAFTRVVQSPFRTRAFRLFFPITGDQPPLTTAAVHWFGEGRFDFTLGETLSLLRQDQLNSGDSRLSLVLSGGGVKSLYQAELLHEMYSSDGSDRGPLLRNFGAAPTDPSLLATGDSALVVHNVIGTSGGAILAFFAAQLPNIANLSQAMRDMAADDVFPYLDLPRTLSVLVLLTILLTALFVARTMSTRYREEATSVDKGAPLKLLLASVAVFIGGVVALRIVHGYNFENGVAVEGIFFIAAVGVLHMVTTCAVQANATRQPNAVAQGRIAIVFGAVLIVSAVLVSALFRDSATYEQSAGLTYLSILVSAGTLVIALGIARLVSAGSAGLRVGGLGDYVSGLGVLVLFVVITYLLLFALSIMGISTLLELTDAFWLGLLGCGTLTAIGLLFWLRKPRSYAVANWLRQGVTALMRDRVRGVTTTMMATIVIASALGLSLWTVVVAPSIYGNKWALGTVQQAIQADGAGRDHFNANLVVTGTLLTETRCGPTGSDLPAGGLYMCFDGGKGCGGPLGPNWQVFRKPSPMRAFDAVFASGSPFPVFPRHLAHTPRGLRSSPHRWRLRSQRTARRGQDARPKTSVSASGRKDSVIFRVI